MASWSRACGGELGSGYQVRCPRLPAEGDPGYARWGTAIRRELAALDDGAVVAGHSAGAAVLVTALAEQPPGKGLAGDRADRRPVRRPGRLARR